MTLIGLTGPAGAGKDTVAALLVRDWGFSQLSFAGPLKDALVVMLGIPRSALNDRATKEAPIDWIGKSPRQLMQTLGTEWGRQLVHDDLWIRHAERRLANMRRYSDRVTITDVRFENEARWVRAQGGTIWHIRRTADAAAVNPHESEHGVRFNADAGDDVINNTSDIAHLATELQAALTPHA